MCDGDVVRGRERAGAWVLGYGVKLWNIWGKDWYGRMSSNEAMVYHEATRISDAYRVVDGHTLGCHGKDHTRIKHVTRVRCYLVWLKVA